MADTKFDGPEGELDLEAEDELEVEDEVEDEVEEGDEGEESDEADEGADDGDEEAKAAIQVKTKKEGRFAVLARRAKEAEERAQKVEEDLQRFQQQRIHQDRAAWEAAERVKLDNMLPDERAAYLSDQRFNHMQMQLQQTQFQMAEMAEKTSFESKASVNPTYAKYADRVEKMKADYLKDGKNVSRENILYHLIGKDALGKGTKAGARLRANGAAKKAAAKGRPASGRGDMAGSSRGQDDSLEALESRLKDQYI